MEKFITLTKEGTAALNQFLGENGIHVKGVQVQKNCVSFNGGIISRKTGIISLKKFLEGQEGDLLAGEFTEIIGVVENVFKMNKIIESHKEKEMTWLQKCAMICEEEEMEE